jgi:hypothetical protein
MSRPPQLSQFAPQLLEIIIALESRGFFGCGFTKLRQGNGFARFFLPDNGSFGAGLHTAGPAAAEVADIDDVLENLQGPDGAVDFTGTAQGASCRGDIDLTVRPDGQGFFRAFEAVSLAALDTDDGTIHSTLIQVENLDAGETGIDFPGVEK